MKQLLFIAVLMICLASCQKDVSSINEIDVYLQNVKTHLQDSLSKADFSVLDFGRSVQSRINKDTSFFRIPFKGKSLKQEFVLLQVNDRGSIKQGRMILLAPRINTLGQPTIYNGGIIIRSLKGKVLVDSRINNGFIEAFHPNLSALQRTASSLDPYSTLPEVVVVAYRSSGGISYGDFMYIQGIFGGGFGGYSNYYSSVDGYADFTNEGGGGYSGGGGGGSSYIDPPILIDFESQQANPGIDLQKFINCFSAIPDAGSTCTIEILSDLPVDNDPNKLFNFDSESPGHVFLQIRKSNGPQSVLQNIGFYPETNWKAMLTPAPVKGKFVDNGRHEFNASLKMSLTPAQLRTTFTHMQSLANFIRYDIDEYNCTDFALEVFNYVRHPANKIEIPKYDIPGGMASAGTSTPQGLFNKLKSMQQSGSTEASNISIPGYKGWVAGSKGSCN